MKDWQEFAAALAPEYTDLAHQEQVSRMTPECVHLYRDFLERRFKGDCDAMNRIYRETFFGWGDNITLPTDHFEDRQTRLLSTLKYRDFLSFKQGLAPRYRIPVSMDGMWYGTLSAEYGKDLKAISAAHGTTYATIAEVRLPDRLPANQKVAADWVTYVRNELPFHYLRVDAAAAADFRQALQQRYGTIQSLNHVYQKNYSDWSQVPFSESVPEEEAPRLDWTDFVTTSARPQFFHLRTPEVLYQEWLAKKYGSVAALNQVYGTRYAAFAVVDPPRYESEWAEMVANKSAIKHEFVVRNYREVIEYFTVHGRAIWNTFVLVAGLLLVTLIINPLAAFALSRYQLPGNLQDPALPARHHGLPGRSHYDSGLPVAQTIPSAQHLLGDLLALYGQRLLHLPAEGLLRQPAAGAVRGGDAGRGARSHHVHPHHRSPLQARARGDRAGHLHRGLRDVHVRLRGLPGPEHVDNDGVAVPDEFLVAAVRPDGRPRAFGDSHAAGVHFLPEHHHAGHHPAGREVKQERRQATADAVFRLSSALPAPKKSYLTDAPSSPRSWAPGPSCRRGRCAAWPPVPGSGRR